MATSKTNWKSFFTFEKQLLAFISQQKILAGNKDDLSYKETPYKNSILERPPKFIHAIVSLQDNTETFKKVETDIEELKRLYLAVSNKANYPSRFPQLLTGVVKIYFIKMIPLLIHALMVFYLYIKSLKKNTRTLFFGIKYA